MRQVIIQPTFEEWRTAARSLLVENVPPGGVIWMESADAEGSLDLFETNGKNPQRYSPAFSNPALSNTASVPAVPRKFLDSAKRAALHSSKQRWSLLYRMLWRLTHGEPNLLEIPTDSDLLSLTHLEKEVQKDAYRMQAFLRFRETRLNDLPWFVAWYEPEHDIIELNERFFVDRFANMRWSILTPKRCMHWDGEAIRFSPGVTRASAPTSDDLEPLWITYYSNIFNPARIKPAAMQAQLLKRNWKNLPEAAVIEPLLRNAPRRTAAMIERSDFLRVRDSDYSLAQPPSGANLNELRNAAKSCRACPLWKTANCTVFGEGPQQARIVLVGEQPGDQEDRAGKPFIGPAGQMLDRALALAGIDRQHVYVTNAVKHFKFEPRGKRRIHKTANSRDIAACRPWLAAELALIRPELVVALGATAARSLFNSPVRITEERGRMVDGELGRTLITIHPSALLRLPEGSDFAAEFSRFVSDLRLATTVIDPGLPNEPDDQTR